MQTFGKKCYVYYDSLYCGIRSVYTPSIFDRKRFLSVGGSIAHHVYMFVQWQRLARKCKEEVRIDEEEKAYEISFFHLAVARFKKHMK